MSDINEIAGVHLGKAGDGSAVKPYVTPDYIDAGLLVAVPRVLNRTQYNIDESNLPFVGSDTWNCYEFSTLMDNGYPVSGLLRIVYPANSPNIVESKSLKLYLNSYNMVRSGPTVDHVKAAVVDTIKQDLTKCVGKPVAVELHFDQGNLRTPFQSGTNFYNLDESVILGDLVFDKYNEDPNILETVPLGGNATARWTTRSLRSNCRVTNQPDWGDVFIFIKGERTVTPESLLQYIVSMRRENHFHEEICECIYKRLWDLLNPNHLLVACLYTRRGGIDINPIRANSLPLINTYAPGLINAYNINVKTLRQ